MIMISKAAEDEQLGEVRVMELKVAFVPFAAPGHMIPLMHIARAFARHGGDVTFITTPANAVRFQNDVESDSLNGHKIKLHTFELPVAEVGLPPGVESFTHCTSKDMVDKLFLAFQILDRHIEHFLRQIGADCIVSDPIYLWTTEAASRLGIPRLAFRSSGFFSECIQHFLRHHEPYQKVASDTEPFTFDGFPHEIEMTKLELPEWLWDESILKKFWDMERMDQKSYGVIMNSFNELEGDYVEYFRSVVGMRTWAIGPVFLLVKNSRVTTENRKEKELMEWLDSKEVNSVVYVSFGSMIKFPSAQLVEIAHGLEDSGHQFIWVVRKMEEEVGEEFPEGFEERVRGSNRGLIIRDWAPQDLILNHVAVGGFVTHCGWNSILESVCAGCPIAAWPLTAEQFSNEKLVTGVLKIGVSVGMRKWWDRKRCETLDVVTRDRITKAVGRLMGDGGEAIEMRERVRELSCAAKGAMEEGGSSNSSFLSLIEELKAMKLKRQSNGVNG